MIHMTAFEQAVMCQILLRHAPNYPAQIQALHVTERDLTGVGFYTYFDQTLQASCLPETDRMYGSDLYCEIEGLEGGAGFILWLDQGKIDTLEAFSYAGEDLVPSITNFELSWHENLDQQE